MFLKLCGHKWCAYYRQTLQLIWLTSNMVGDKSILQVYLLHSWLCFLFFYFLVWDNVKQYCKELQCTFTQVHQLLTFGSICFILLYHPPSPPFCVCVCLCWWVSWVTWEQAAHIMTLNPSMCISERWHPLSYTVQFYKIPKTQCWYKAVHL